LFLTRSYPPVIGGIEQYCYDLFRHLAEVEDVVLCANSKGKRYLGPFLAKAVVHLLRNRKTYSHIHFGDGVLAPLALLAKAISRSRISITIYGLDITYPSRLYQTLVPRCAKRLDAVVCISRATVEECVTRGVPRELCTFIAPGIASGDVRRPTVSLAEIEWKYGFGVGGRRILLSISRLVKRKGHTWFLSNVLPRLDDTYMYVIGGDGPERSNIERMIAGAGLGQRAFVLGPVTHEEKVCLYESAHLFIMPNIHVPGDLEGFGITLIEAAARGLPGIASRTDGIPDAVLEGETGYLVEELDAEAFAERIRSCQLRRAEVRAKAEAAYSWEEVVARYREIFR
jgi:glycosyltransferase involved in cell wall biosynthesis